MFYFGLVFCLYKEDHTQTPAFHQFKPIFGDKSITWSYSTYFGQHFLYEQGRCKAFHLFLLRNFMPEDLLCLLSVKGCLLFYLH